MLYKDGILSEEEFTKLLPSDERRKKGPYVIVECLQGIPCNPCVTSCRVGAIKQANLTDIPAVSHDSCIGCSACVGACPGHACFVIDESISDDTYLLSLPYEMLPNPKAGEIADLLNREGTAVDKGVIRRVVEHDKTYVVTVEVPKKYLYEVRSIRLN